MAQSDLNYEQAYYRLLGEVLNLRESLKRQQAHVTEVYRYAATVRKENTSLRRRNEALQGELTRHVIRYAQNVREAVL